MNDSWIQQAIIGACMRKDDNMSTFQSDFSPESSAEQTLSAGQPESVDVLRQLCFQYTQDGFSVVDLDGRHVDVNPAFCRMTGYTAAELLESEPEHCYWPPEEVESIQYAFAATLRGELSQIEVTFMRKNGERFPAVVEPFAIRDSGGEVRFYGATVRDVTRQFELESALRRSEERFRVLFENAGDAITIMQDSRIVECNNQNIEMYGIPIDEILPKPTTDFFPATQPNGRDSREFYHEMVEASRSGEPQHFEWHGLNRDGTPVITEVTLTSFMLGDKLCEQTISRDITRRKQVEASLVELNRNLEQRVAQRTEELEEACNELLQRNFQYRALARKLTQAEEKERKRIAQLLHDNHQQLLVAAKFKTEMLQSSGNNLDVQEYSGQILDILDQALEVTRSLTMELAPPILFGQGFVAAMQWLANWMEEHHQLQVVVRGSLPLTPIDADVSSLLFRAIRELLFNVSKHSGINRACVDIALIDQEAQVIVTDEGNGFDVAAVLQTTSYGLLSIQEQLISHKGRLQISSAPGRGTAITLTIPMATTDVSALELSQSVNDLTTLSTNSQQLLGRPVRILVVDDHVMARHALVQILGLMEDFEVVDEAVDGLDAVQKARKLRPDVILMDSSMPRLNGLQATRRITTELPEIKVIGLSMHGMEDMQPQMLAAGASRYLQKLTPAEVLFATIRDVMQPTKV
jgi:PAS domain S-box-containing protein